MSRRTDRTASLLNLLWVRECESDDAFTCVWHQERQLVCSKFVGVGVSSWVWHDMSNRVYFECAGHLEIPHVLCVAVCCSVLQCVAVCCRDIHKCMYCHAACWSVLQCVAVCCNMMQCVAEYVADISTNACNVMQCTQCVCAVCCSALQCVAEFVAEISTNAWCNVMQCTWAMPIDDMGSLRLVGLFAEYRSLL